MIKTDSEKRNSRKALANIKFFLIPVATAGGLILGLGLNQINKAGNNPVNHSLRPADNGNSLSASETLKTIRVLKQRGNAATEDLPAAGLRQNGEDPSFSRVRLLSQRNGILQKNGNPGISRAAGTPNAQKSFFKIKDYIKTIEEKNSFLKDKVGLLNALVDSKEKELSKTSQDNTGLKEDLGRITESQNKLKSDFTAGLNDLNVRLADKDSRILDLNALKLSLEGQLNELSSKFSSLSVERCALQKQVDQLKDDKAFMEIEMNKLNESLGRQSAVNKALNESVNALKGELTEKERANLAMLKQLEQLEQSRQDMQQQLNELKVTKASSQEEVIQLNERIGELSLALEGAKKSADQATSLLNKRKLERELKFRDKESEIADLRDSLVRAEEEKNTLQGYLQEKDKNIAELKTALSGMKGQMSVLERKVSLEKERQLTTVEQAAKTDSERSALLLSLQEKIKTIEELKLALRNMESQMAQLQAKLVSEKRQQEEVSKQLEKALSFNDSLKGKLKSIYVEIELLRTEKRFDSE